MYKYFFFGFVIPCCFLSFSLMLLLLRCHFSGFDHTCNKKELKYGLEVKVVS